MIIAQNLTLAAFAEVIHKAAENKNPSGNQSLYLSKNGLLFIRYKALL
jgi:hypothetical protein